MKTTLEISDHLFRAAKSRAAKRGQTLRQFVTDAVHEKLSAALRDGEQPAWMKHFGAAKGMEASIREIDAAIEEEFEKID